MLQTTREVQMVQVKSAQTMCVKNLPVVDRIIIFCFVLVVLQFDLTYVIVDWVAIAFFLPPQFGVWPQLGEERRHQEAEPALSESNSREKGLQRTGAHEMCQPQERKSSAVLRFFYFTFFSVFQLCY